MNRYHINLFRSEPDACWIADVPDLKSCAAHGETPAEALGEVQTAMRAWLDLARERGLQVPEARYRPAIYAAE